MKKYILLSLVLAPSILYAQSAIDGYQLSQPDLKGTARYMSMGGAFGALGGDMSVLSQNPGGIGVYRNSDFGFTVDLDCQNSSTKSQVFKTSENQTKFLLNSIGYVGTLKLANSVVPNVNFGFTYQKAASFNRKYSGYVSNLNNSLSNYIAGVANTGGATIADLETDSSYDPYNPTDGGWEAPWITILGYDSYLINPTGSEDAPVWEGQWGSGTSGSGYFNTQEKGGIDEYNLSIGGNFGNVVFWGMDFGITDLNYTSETLWGENLQDAYVVNSDNSLGQTTANWDLYNYHNVKGNGFNYKLGFIVKPVQELRLGFAFHTPTWYNIDEAFYGDVAYMYGNDIRKGTAYTNNGYDAYSSYNFRTPWRLIFSAAGVIGRQLIVSADYEWEPYSGMHYSRSSSWDYDYVSVPQMYDEYADTNMDIKDYYQASHTLRVGAEYRVTPRLSVRAGYSYVSSPVTSAAKNNLLTVYTAGTRPQYTWDNSTNYITCGIGYKYQKFYVDAAYVYKHRSSEYHAYTPDLSSNIASPEADLTTSNSQVVLTMGFKF
jgi:hypothetical protein